MIAAIILRSAIEKTALLVLATILLAGCNGTGEESSDYIRQINQWHQQRISGLTEDDSWLSLAGLYPLREGEQTFGADTTNDIIFPPDKAHDEMGIFLVDDDAINVQAESEVEILHNGKPVQSLELQSDAAGKPTVLTYGPMRWYVIERGGEYFVRLKDTEHPRLARFDGIERFPVRKEWRVKATFEPFESVDTMEVPNVLDQTSKEPLYGRLQFTVNGQQFSLAPEGDPGGNEFFIVFGDATNGESTVRVYAVCHMPVAVRPE